ncbi:MAG: hypothetical protein ACQEXJ_12855 [Myxococcota bacterium]
MISKIVVLLLATCLLGSGMGGASARAEARQFFSDASAPASSTTAVRITTKKISVDDVSVVEVNCSSGGQKCEASDYESSSSYFSIDAASKAGNTASYLIVPLREELISKLDRAKQANEGKGDFEASVTIEPDDQVPFRILLEVVHTAGVAGYSTIRLSHREEVATMGLPASGRKASKPKQKPLKLTVLATSRGRLVKYRSGDSKGDERVEKQQGNPLDDLMKLYARLMQLKKRFPDAKTLNIGAEQDTPWKVIASTIRASRWQRGEDSYESGLAWLKSTRAMASDGRPKPLFPRIQFVVAY